MQHLKTTIELAKEDIADLIEGGVVIPEQAQIRESAKILMMNDLINLEFEDIEEDGNKTLN